MHSHTTYRNLNKQRTGRKTSLKSKRDILLLIIHELYQLNQLKYLKFIAIH